MMKDLPLHFPNESDKIYREAEQFRRMSPTERFVVLLDVIASGAQLLAVSPNRQQIEELRLRDREQSRQIQREFLARHGH